MVIGGGWYEDGYWGAGIRMVIGGGWYKDGYGGGLV